MPDIDPTPETPVTVGDRLGWWRGEMAAQHTALLEALAAQHASLLEAQAAQHAALLNALSQSGTSDDTTAQILAAIGRLDTYPAQWTVRALLAQLNTHIDSEPTPDNPPGEEIPPDPGGCGDPTPGWFYVWRAYMIDTGINNSFGGQDCDIFAIAAIPAIPGILEAVHEWAFGLTESFRATYPDGMVNFCVSWDFDALPVLSYGYHVGAAPSTAAIPVCHETPLIVASRNQEIQSWYSNRHNIGWYFAVPAGNPVPEGIYCHVQVLYEVQHPS